MAQQSQIIGKLSHRAMLVNPSMTMWTARKTDKRASDEVHAAHGSDAKMGRYWKALIDPVRMEPLSKLVTRARGEHRARTLPWLDDGARILMTAGFVDYDRIMRAFADDFNALAMTWLQEYGPARDEARRLLNGLFDPNDYPPLDVIARKFSFRMTIQPWPESADFRADVGDQALEAIRQSIAATERAVVEQAMKSVWTRVHEAVSHMSRRLAAYTVEPDGKVSGIFRDSLVDNVRDLVALLPTLNLTDDPALDDVAGRMRATLTTHDAQTLRDSPTARDQTRDAADEILDVVNEFMG